PLPQKPLGAHEVSPWNIPNAMTVTRIVLAPAACWLLLAGDAPTACITFMTAGALDFFDGWLARRWNQETAIGSYLDPLADKLLVGSAFVTCGYTGLLPWWAVTIGLCRDVGLLSAGMYLRAATKPAHVGFFDFSHPTSLPMEPTLLSKGNTVLQISAVAAALCTGAWGFPGTDAVMVLSTAMTATSVVSGLQYYQTWGSVDNVRRQTDLHLQKLEREAQAGAEELGADEAANPARAPPAGTAGPRVPHNRSFGSTGAIDRA
ncbi:CLS, partial [Symbiodinium sp. KB8]